MAKPVTITWSTERVQKEFGIDLKNRNLAALLAWLVPGLGHFYQGRTAKGVLFSVCIIGTFLFGMYVGDGHVAYASTQPLIRNFVVDRWPFVCQAGIGAVAIPAMVERNRALRGAEPQFGGWFQPPRKSIAGGFTTQDAAKNTVYHPDELAKWNYEGNFFFDLGTIYTVIAGLLNVLAIYDAHAGPMIVVPVVDEKKPEPDTKSESGDKS